MEIWLRTNQRVMAAGLLLPGAAIVGGCLMAALSAGATRWVGAGLVLLAGVYSLLLVTMLRRPLLAYRDGQLLVFLKSTAPEQVPIEFVEFFFRGEGPVEPADEDGPNASNIVVRLAERAESFKRREVKQSLGNWCDGYITIRGMWCEPINAPLLGQLNRHLVEKHRELKQAEGPESDDAVAG